MVNVFSAPKKKEENTENLKQTSKSEPSASSEQPVAVCQKLKIEEAQLSEEKQNLTQLKEQLQKKIKDQIENKKNHLQKLKEEINDLQFECAQLNETLQNDILAE